jgi:hypothetical protein
MAKIINMQQVQLKYQDGDNVSQLTTWIELDKDIKVGSQVKLKDDARWWDVTEVYSTILPMTEVESNRNWDNNNYDKHDGTSLKKRVGK